MEMIWATVIAGCVIWSASDLSRIDDIRARYDRNVGIMRDAGWDYLADKTEGLWRFGLVGHWVTVIGGTTMLGIRALWEVVQWVR